MVVLTTGFDGFDILPLIPVSLDSMLLIPGLAGFNVFFFQICRPLASSGQIVFFLASSGAECLPGVHSGVRTFFLLQNVCIPCYSHCGAHGCLILVWRFLWCCEWLCVQHLHLLNCSEGSLVHLWC